MTAKRIIQAAAGNAAGGSVNPNAYDFYNYGVLGTREAAEAFNIRPIISIGSNWKDNIRTAGYSAYGHYGLQYCAPPWMWNSTGTKVLIWPYSSSNRYLMEASCSTAWDLTTLSFDDSLDISSYFESGDTDNSWGAWSKDGQNIYIFTQTYLYHFTLTTAFDVSSGITKTYGAYYQTFAAQNSGTASGAPNFSQGNPWFVGDGSALHYCNGSYYYTMPLISGGTAFDLNDYHFAGVSTGRQQISTLDKMKSTSLSSRISLMTNNDGSRILVSSNSSTGSGYGITFDMTDPTDATTISVDEFADYKVYAFGESTGGTAGPYLMPFRSTHDNPTGKDFMGYYFSIDYQVGEIGSNAFMGSYNAHPYGTGNVETYMRVLGGHFVGDSGTKFYRVGNYGRIGMYTLSTPYEICTAADDAAHDPPVYDVSTEFSSFGNSLFFKDDGTKMYVCSNTNKIIYQYSLSTGWDISTASYDSKSYSTGSYTFPAFCLSGDGTYLYLTTYSTRKILRATLSTPWDISTASLDSGQELSQSLATSSNTGVAINNEGTKIYIAVRQSFIDCFTLSTPWDLTSATSDGRIDIGESSMRVPGWESPLIHEIRLDDTGERLYVNDYRSGAVYQITIDGS
jgi:hypothetical protein